MSSVIRAPKDFFSGALFIVIGIAAMLIARDYSMGSVGRMGRLTFPPSLADCLR